MANLPHFIPRPFLGGPGGHRPPSFDKLKEKADTNGDGQISKAEFSSAQGPNGKTPTDEMVTRFFGKIDTNGDDIITQAEIDAAPKGPPGGPGGFGGPPPIAFSKLLEKVDSNADNQISKDEFSTTKGPNGRLPSADMVTRFFEKIDTNSDGIITKAELDAAKESRRAGFFGFPPPAEG